MTNTPLMLDHVFAHAQQHPELIYLTQPTGQGRVVNYTWGQVLDQSLRMAAHLQSCGYGPGARIAMISKNSAHFIMAELAIWMAGCTTVAIFPTETADTVRYVLQHSGASALFVGKLDNWPQQQHGVPEGLTCIALPLAPPTAFETWDAIVARTPPLAGRPTRAADDLAMLLYTSGSTGTPKGVMTSFAGLTAAGVCIAQDTRSRIGEQAPIRMLSYLPLAHSYERSWVEASSLVDGRVQLFFAESLDTFLQDLQRARPTLFISVPRLWRKFQQGVFAKMPPAKLDRLLGLPLIGRLVARKVLKGLGLDQVVVAGSGSAPIPAELIRWYRRLGLALYEGYGMTEDNSLSHTSNAAHNAPGCVGVAMPGVQVRISPQGEILIKSPARMVGYYRQPELTAECFTEDGFFRTGDLGELGAGGLLKITGRAKEIFKTAKGKYVAPAPLENRLNAHPMVELSMVAGVGQPAAFGLVLLAENLRPRLDDPAVRAEVHAAMETLLRDLNSGLADYAQLCMLVILREPWSVENGCLTPTMKIKRSHIEALIAPKVERWYADGHKVQWA